MDTKQRPWKSLKQNLEKFTSELSQMEDPNSRIASRIFRDGLNRDQELYEIFVRKPSNSIQEIITEAEECIRVEEAGLERTDLDVWKDGKNEELTRGHGS